MAADCSMNLGRRSGGYLPSTTWCDALPSTYPASSISPNGSCPAWTAIQVSSKLAKVKHAPPTMESLWMMRCAKHKLLDLEVKRKCQSTLITTPALAPSQLAHTLGKYGC